MSFSNGHTGTLDQLVPASIDLPLNKYLPAARFGGVLCLELTLKLLK